MILVVYGTYLQNLPVYWKWINVKLKVCLEKRVFRLCSKQEGVLRWFFFFKWEGKAGAAKENAGLQVIWASCYVESNVFICTRYLTLEHFG